MDAFYGEIRAFAFQWAPTGWAECRGQLVLIQQFTALWALLTTRFGGDGKTTFGLPNLAARTVIGTGTSADPNMGTITIAQNVGVDTVTINSTDQLPAHDHTLNAYGTGTLSKMTEAPVEAQSTVFLPVLVNSTYPSGARYPAYNATATADQQMDPAMLQSAGGVAVPAPHDNHQPYLPMRFFICQDGYWPVKP